MKKPIGRTAFLTGVAVLAVSATALATDGKMISSSNVSVGRFDEIDVKTNDAVPHQVKVKTKGASDVYVVSNTFLPGGHSGWHTHPGPSLITVKEGTATVYESDDPTCSPRIYPKGTGFIDRGDGEAHLLANEGSVDLVTVAVQILPAGAPRRTGTPRPEACPAGLGE